MKPSLLLTIVAASALTSHAAVLTFEDLGGGAIADGYAGLNWDNIHTLNGTTNPDSGYNRGRVSGDIVAFNAFGSAAAVDDGTFDFNGAYFTGAWNDGLNIRLQGWDGATLLYDQTIVVDTLAPTWFQANFAGIDLLTFESFGGVDHSATDNGSGTHFAMDDFTFNEPIATPEAASSLMLLGMGLTGLAMARRRLFAKV